MYRYLYFKQLDSTNLYAKLHIDNLQNNDIIIASLQTLGRGRLSRSWHATKDSLTFSIIFKDKLIINDFSSLSLISAVAIYQVLKDYVPNVSLKWPNDVLINGKKVCGILLESSSKEEIDNLILGIGININNISLPKDINATSLYLETNKKYDKDAILKKVIENLNYLIEENKKGNKIYLTIFKNNNFLLNKEATCTINGQEKLVLVKDILDDNRILVTCDNQDYALNSGEISFHNNRR